MWLIPPSHSPDMSFKALRECLPCSGYAVLNGFWKGLKYCHPWRGGTSSSQTIRRKDSFLLLCSRGTTLARSSLLFWITSAFSPYRCFDPFLFLSLLILLDSASVWVYALRARNTFRRLLVCDGAFPPGVCTQCGRCLRRLCRLS